ncbi:MAG: NAD-dependent epimerase/dehydratase family protein, partial [Aggregatilineales bacterium]
RSPYAVSKLAAEGYLRVMGIRWGIETVSLRIFNAYGPGQQLPAAHPPVIPSFLRHALRGGSLVVNGDGAQTRDYIYIDDVVSALIAAATAANVDQKVINVGSGVETSVNGLIEAISMALGRSITPLYVRNQDAGVSRMCADLRLAAELLGFRPKIGLAEGLALTLERDPRFAFAAR